MKIKRMQVGPVWGASGVNGFFGEGYWFHWLLFPLIFWMKLPWVTFVAKTTTLNERKGYTELKKDGITPKQWFPSSVVVKFWKCVVLNAWGLSGPGFEKLLEKNRWQKRKKDFFISFMSVADTLEEQKEELRQFIRKFLASISEFKAATVALQLNVSCPNAGVCIADIVAVAYALLAVIQEEDPGGHIVVCIKLAPTVSVVNAAMIARHDRCDSLCIPNTIPFGQMADDVDWVGLFGTADPKESPLSKRGMAPGGLSGKPLLPITCRLVEGLRRMGVTKHINAGGGITGPWSALKVFWSGADSIFLGTITTLRPWNVLPVIITAYVVHWYRKLFSKPQPTL